MAHRIRGKTIKHNVFTYESIVKINPGYMFRTMETLSFFLFLSFFLNGAVYYSELVIHFHE